MTMSVLLKAAVFRRKGQILGLLASDVTPLALAFDFEMESLAYSLCRIVLENILHTLSCAVYKSETRSVMC